MREIVEVNGVSCILYRDVYKGRDKSGEHPYLYYLRHADDDWDEPVTIEPYVFVNRYGVIQAKQQLLEPSESYRDIEILEVESEKGGF